MSNKNKFKTILAATFLCCSLFCSAQTVRGLTDMPGFKFMNFPAGRLEQFINAQKANVHGQKTIKIDGPIDNMYKVSTYLYRGARPDGEEDLKYLKSLGIKTIVDLRIESPSYSDLARKHGFKYVEIPMTPVEITDADVQSFINTFGMPNNLPVYVHCRYGSDRTGAMVAAYRIVFAGWTNDAAANEMVKGGYKFSPIFAMLVKYIKGFDRSKIKVWGVLARPEDMASISQAR